MSGELTGRARKTADLMLAVLLTMAALLAVFALIAQHDLSLLTGFLAIQLGEAGLITDPICTGGPGAALLNAAVLLAVNTLLLRSLRVPYTGLPVACLFLMAGFSLLGKNLVNSLPIMLGGLLYARYKREPFSRYVCLTMLGTCLAPMVSFLLLHMPPGFRLISAVACGALIGFLLPAVSGYTVRVHQGYNLYNVGFSAGIVGLGFASVFKGFEVEFYTEGSWSTGCHVLLSVLVSLILLLLLGLGVLCGCRRWCDYRGVLRHSGRAATDFLLLEGLGPTLVNMALVGAVGFAYLLLRGVPLNGPLVCCILAMTGFGAFGKHPRNVIPVMAGAILSATVMGNVPVTAPVPLLATLLCTCLAPIAGRFGWGWGVAAGFLHMAIVQHTAILHEGMNLYNNGFAAGFVCILLVPVIEALRPEPKE